MPCWNALHPEQQDRLIEIGNLPINYVERDPWHTGAEVAIELPDDQAPGPRFYCRPCAISLLLGVTATEEADDVTC
jgi:hypothetical protein